MTSSQKPMLITPFDIALGELGQHEIPGILRNNPRIVRYFTATDLPTLSITLSDETPWCAAFVNWCLREASVKGTGSARARSFLTWGQDVPWRSAELGDVVVLSRGNNAARGHVGFCVGWEDEQHILLLGGNQSNHVSINAYGISRILAVRRYQL